MVRSVHAGRPAAGLSPLAGEYSNRNTGTPQGQATGLSLVFRPAPGMENRLGRPKAKPSTARWRALVQSGREDLNLRPHRPERCALPDCATPRSVCDSDSIPKLGRNTKFLGLKTAEENGLVWTGAVFCAPSLGVLEWPTACGEGRRHPLALSVRGIGPRTSSQRKESQRGYERSSTAPV